MGRDVYPPRSAAAASVGASLRPLARSLWRVVPETTAETPKIRAVVDWLDEIGAASRSFAIEPG